jgi:hypothetical protein
MLKIADNFIIKVIIYGKDFMKSHQEIIKVH